jgi:GNAT superfamily N-acetyltransferase
MTTEHDIVAQIIPAVREGRANYKPFSDDKSFEDSWWSGVAWGYGDGETEFLSFQQGGVEVARAELSLDKRPNEDYQVPSTGRRFVQVEFFEVSEDHRSRGVGTRAMRAVAQRYPAQCILAYSEEADEFWSSLGWIRFQNSSSRNYRPLYVSNL